MSSVNTGSTTKSYALTSTAETEAVGREIVLPADPLPMTMALGRLSRGTVFEEHSALKQDMAPLSLVALLTLSDLHLAERMLCPFASPAMLHHVGAGG